MLKIACIDDEKEFRDTVGAFLERYAAEKGLQYRVDFFDDGMSFMRQKHSFFSNGMKKEPGSTPGSCPFSKMKERQRRQARGLAFFSCAVCACSAVGCIYAPSFCLFIKQPTADSSMPMPNTTAMA